jgi:hypothetical protein
VERPSGKVLRAISYGVLAPAIISTVLWVVLLAIGRIIPAVPGAIFGSCNELLEALYPESSYKGLFVPILTMVLPPVFLGDGNATLFL